MKRIILLSFAAAFLLSACEKNDLNENKIWDYTPGNPALVKFLNSFTGLTPSLGSPANGPTIDYYINGQKMNATAMGYATIFPNVSGSYSAATSGTVKIKAVLNRTAGGGVATDTIASNNFILGPNVGHSVILVDDTPNPTPFNPILMVVQESVSMPAYGKYKLRLMNLVVTPDLYELYNSTTATVLTAGIPFKNLSDWIELPVLNTSHTFQIRKVGSITSLASVSLTAANQRSYTFWARGNTAVTGRGLTLSTYISQ